MLPGAFSTFRWEAIKGDPLTEFYQGLNKKGQNMLKQNMYLAEDRIMCFEIVHQKERKYRLMYLPDAVALTDPPPNLAALINQRRRWINGALATQVFLNTKIS